MTIKKLILAALLQLAATLTASAALVFDSGFDNGGNIPDGNLSPWSDTRNVSGITGQISAVSVWLNLTGGYNGDLYAYLSYNGVRVPLLNRVGAGYGDAFGYGDAGMTVTFTDMAANNIHFYQSIGGYSIAGGALWKPDGRLVNPVTSLPEDFNADGTVSLGVFNGMSADGGWTLVVADVSGGGGQSKVVSWGLDIVAVPEPVTTGVMSGLTACLTLAAALWRRRPVKKNTP